MYVQCMNCTRRAKTRSAIIKSELNKNDGSGFRQTMEREVSVLTVVNKKSPTTTFKHTFHRLVYEHKNVNCTGATT